ncbi:MAG TPA: hypothetical protein VFC84_10985 [Desulfosporosinus sp.]|nr:hypothetical protein [Desulfosporosinus sp.]
MKLNRLGLVFIVLGLTITTVACGSKKTADPIGFYDVEIESGRIWDLATNKIAIPN